MVQIIKKNKLLTAVMVAYILLFIFMPEKANQSVKNSMYYVIEMIEIIPVIFVLTSIIETWVPKEVIMKGFGEKSGVKGIILSFLLGSFSAGPIYAAFPVCKMLLKKGANINNVVIILSTWAVIKVPMLVNEVKFLGIQFMGVRWVLTVIIVIIMAYLMGRFVKKESMPIKEKDEPTQIAGVDISESFCVGCGLCARMLPEHFEVVNHKARWKESILNKEKITAIETVIGKCPAKVITFK